MGGDEDKGEVEGNLVRMCYSSRIKMKPISSTYIFSQFAFHISIGTSLISKEEVRWKKMRQTIMSGSDRNRCRFVCNCRCRYQSTALVRLSYYSQNKQYINNYLRCPFVLNFHRRAGGTEFFLFHQFKLKLKLKFRLQFKLKLEII